jgi:hypothetical protein
MNRAHVASLRPVLRALVFAATCLVVSNGATASAETSESDRATARTLMREGKQARTAGDHGEAAKKFRAAYALVATPVTGIAFARELVALGHLVEASDLLVAIGRMPVSPTETSEGAKARTDAATLLAEITPKIASVVVSLDGWSAGRTPQVTIDGARSDVAAAGAGVRLDPGVHEIVVRVDGREQAKTVSLAEGARGSGAFDFTPPPPPPIPSPPPTTIGAPSVAAPATTTPGLAGASAAPRVDGRRSVLVSPSSSLRWASVAAIGAGAIGLGVGGLLGLSAKSSYDDARRLHCPTGACDPQGLSGIADAQGRARVATVFVGVGAVVAATGVVLWLAAPSGAEAKTGVHAVGLGPSSITLVGSF